MYMYVYLNKCIYDFGFVYFFWFFSFECENGVLGFILINKRDMEV